MKHNKTLLAAMIATLVAAPVAFAQSQSDTTSKAKQQSALQVQAEGAQVVEDVVEEVDQSENLAAEQADGEDDEAGNSIDAEDTAPPVAGDSAADRMDAAQEQFDEAGEADDQEDEMEEEEMGDDPR